MDSKLDNILCETFPNLYRDRHAPMNITAMCWGFDVMQGWYKIIYDLSVKLEELILALPEEERPLYRASQVKEKFGGLRFYMSAQTEEMTDAIYNAELLADKTCEYCGKPGKLTEEGWMFTLCNECDKTRPWRNK